MKKIIPIYKEKGISSHGAVDKVREITGERRVGHAGTLDPEARGVLVIAISRESTKRLGSIIKKEKEYLADIKLGEKSTTNDNEGKKTNIKVEKKPTEEKIKKVLKSFKGVINQRPPRFSAIKINGKRAYKLARKGKEINISERKVEIKDIKFINYKWPILRIKVVTGPGVYIRALARDIGERLNTGGYIKSLERTRVGDFQKKDSLTITQFKKLWEKSHQKEEDL